MLTIDAQTARVRCLAYAPDGETLASGGNGTTVRFWEPATGRALGSSGTGNRFVNALAFSPDGGRLVAGGQGRILSFFDTSTRRVIAGRPGHFPGPISALAYAPDGATLVSTDADRRGGPSRVILWDLTTIFIHRAALLTVGGGGTQCASFAPDGRTVALGTIRTTLILWEPGAIPPGRPRELRHEWGEPPPAGITELNASPSIPEAAALHPCDVRAAAFSPDGRTLAAAMGPIVILRERDGYRPLAILKGHRAFVRSLAFAPDGRTLATASHDGTVRLWDANTGAERACLDWGIGKVDCVAFSPDGMTIAAGGEGQIVVWDAGGA